MGINPHVFLSCCVLESLCNGSFFMCANGRCVPLLSVCNLHDDCGDQSDERNCNVNECLNRRVSQCTQECHDLPVGYKVCVSVLEPEVIKRIIILHLCHAVKL